MVEEAPKAAPGALGRFLLCPRCHSYSLPSRPSIKWALLLVAPTWKVVKEERRDRS